MSRNANNFAPSPDEWPATRSYGTYAAPTNLPLRRPASFLSRSVSFRPVSEFDRGMPESRWMPEERAAMVAPSGLASYQAPESPQPRFLFLENVDPRPRVSIQESPPRNLGGQLGPPVGPVLPEEDSELTAEEQKTALKKLRKEIYNPLPGRFSRRVSLYYREHSRNGSNTGVNNKKDDDDGKRCAVCLEDFEPKEEVMLTPCNHMFHEDCIVPWVKSHGQCPVCRSALFEQMKRSPFSNNRVPQTTVMGNDLLIGEIASIVRAVEEVAFQWSRLNH